MSDPPGLTEPEIAARLRAAGCVFAEDEARLLHASGTDPAEVAGRVERRIAGEPLEHLLGWAEFAGLRIPVAPGVFVPRRRTEYLVVQARARTAPGDVVLDLCCGSGALGMALAAAVPGVELYAADSEPAAVACARANLAPLGGRVFQGDLFDALPAALRGRIDTVLCNAPYVPTPGIDFMPPEARLHEPLVALDGGPDGLAVQRLVAASAARWLAPGGTLLIETGADQAARTAAACSRGGLEARIAHSPEHGATVVLATAPPADARESRPG
ncbi:putative protein N(5)-glutamine methyltransferase [Pseudactinotalea sp. HY158]|uniref:putative protein N(5)-glutamine methyltransferase n=1 Tax=Pseudactinotalea sp. HY158 TaxID=2654547 RepID=UPI00129CC232|nr:putative protein N(5)-glutamine methyltransferase [Pseudactinotalea sp. HY158]QGH68746.1 putative protein N(5)-glutamine methyltransferase [Pseudactinotalea sp. HY158]